MLPGFRPPFSANIDLLIKQTATPHFSAVLLEEKLRRGQSAVKQAALDQAKLSQQLHARTQDFEQSEMKFSRFAQRSAVGLTMTDSTGRILYANNVWYAMARRPRDHQDQHFLLDAVIPEDKILTEAMWNRLVTEKLPVEFQARFGQPTTSDNESNQLTGQSSTLGATTAVLCSAYPDLDDDGNIKTVMACITDVTELKRVEAQLRRRTLEVEQSEMKWKRFADHAPVGIYILDAQGQLEFANDKWPKLEAAFAAVTALKGPVTTKFQLDRLWDNPHHGSEESNASKPLVTLLGNAYAETDEDGGINHIVGWLTDISAQKAAEDVFRKRMDEALEMKRQQENFIDTTSHEIRNPLSVILHCADEIVASLKDYQNSTAGSSASTTSVNHDPRISQARCHPHLTQEVVRNVVDSAETIAYCSLHQKRIVDDILTLSRLDSDLLEVSPVPVQPTQLVDHALKMFEIELKKADVKLTLIKDQALQDLKVHWLMFDPNRVGQILINLVTNAIKFTRDESRRSLTIKISASLDKPSGKDDAVCYIPTSKQRIDHTLGAEWGDGEPVYLTLAVQDTGRGLTDEEQKVLFNRFSQASPKTHVQYGGSGLGLFISRQLTEMQGGQIGVASEAGKGSTFAFFLKTRRTQPPNSMNTEANKPLVLRIDGKISDLCGSSASPMQPQTHERGDESVAAFTEESNRDSSEKDRETTSVLIVEDNLINQRVLSKQLRSRGYAVDVANHGEEALSILKETRFWKDKNDGKDLSVVLMDLEMPVMDGLTCVRKMRELQESGSIQDHIPVIVVTANARGNQIQAALDAGADGVTTKPYRIGEMTEQISRLVVKRSVNGMLANAST